VAEWSKAPDSSSGPLTRAWVQIPLLTTLLFSQPILSHLYQVILRAIATLGLVPIQASSGACDL
ncbi:hypothetical protein LINPERPRIM_LOCUS27133, partial [Linum perenne]